MLKLLDDGLMMLWWFYGSMIYDFSSNGSVSFGIFEGSGVFDILMNP
jgi:hypothetical protein